ncbi:MAG: ABC transporter permease [Candidatus Aenigmarchaeota archaeon]|nr:ABC transporter permease [Candidatus Aenigmarchaeota archaeon]
MELEAIYTIWLREIKRYLRAKERIISSLAMPIFWFLIFGSGMNIAMRLANTEVKYSDYIAPGIIAMALLFTSVSSGVSVIWDREFGFLKEMLVAPISRTSIVIGKSLGGATTALLQGLMIIGLSALFGVKFSLFSLVSLLPLMLLISIGFVNLGLIIASLMETIEGFQLIMNFVVMPLFFLSGALFPIDNLPYFLKIISLIDPLTYGVDAMRYIVLGASHLPFSISLSIITIFVFITSIIGAWVFNKKQ